MAPHEDEDELHELDATHYFKEKVHLNVNELKTLAITLHKFGYEPDDRIERRDLVQIYRTVESAMENDMGRGGSTRSTTKSIPILLQSLEIQNFNLKHSRKFVPCVTCLLNQFNYIIFEINFTLYPHNLCITRW